jgi:hypothetical protein
MNPDFVDLLRAFAAADVRFLIVGAYALAVHGRPRATGDLDVWVDATPQNAGRVMRALATFGAPLSQISESDFATPGVVYQIGLSPGLEAFVLNKRATGRPRDLVDIDGLE